MVIQQATTTVFEKGRATIAERLANSFEQLSEWGRLMKLGDEYDDGCFDLRMGNRPVRLADLGVNLGRSFFSPSNESLVIIHDDGRAYLLDLAWLQAMNGRVEELPIEELVSIACEGPMSRGLLDEEALLPFLEEVGIDEPQACR